MRNSITVNENAARDLPRIVPARVYLELTKPRLSLLVVITTLVGYYLGKLGTESPFLIFHLILGTSLLVGGANAFNQWLEHDIDGRMKRTSARPLPTDRISRKSAFRFAFLASILGLFYLGVFINAFTGFLGFLALLSYVLLYTPLKKITTVATLIGAIPGALPIAMGWAAARNQLNLGAWSLFSILFLWQLPHFLAIGWRCREDYREVDLLMLPALDSTGKITGRQMVLYSLALLPVSLIPTLIGLTGPIYFFGAFLAGLTYVTLSVLCALRPTDRNATRLFFTSMYYLLALLILMILDKNGFLFKALANV